MKPSCKYLQLVFVFLGMNIFHPTLALAAVYNVRFEQVTYQVEPNKPFAAKVIIEPVPPNGLFSYGVTMTLEQSQIPGPWFSTSVPNELSFHTILGVGADLSWVANIGTAKGSVDFFAQPLRPYRNSTIASADFVGGLPEGTYTLVLSPKNDLGATEQIFVDGDAQSLDPDIAFSSAQVVVKSVPIEQAVVAGAIRLNRQTGLYEQKIRLYNPFQQAQKGLRIYLDNLPGNVDVWNAWNAQIDPDGRPYVVYDGWLSPGQYVDLTIEYYIKKRRVIPKPKFTVSNSVVDLPVNPRGTVVGITKGKRLNNGLKLIEFKGDLGQEYYIQYRNGNAPWKTVMPSLIGAGTKQLWIDNGPPKTDALPTAVSNRLYRILATKPPK